MSLKRKPEFDYPTPAAQQTGERSHHDQIIGKQQPEGNGPPAFPEPELPTFRTFQVSVVNNRPDVTVIAHLPLIEQGSLVFVDIVKKQVPATGEWIIYNQYRRAFARGYWNEVNEIPSVPTSTAVQ